MHEGSIPWFAPQLDGREQDYVRDVIAGNYVNDGNIARELEARVAERVGVDYCVAVTSGTVAISLALMGLGVGPAARSSFPTSRSSPRRTPCASPGQT